MNKQILKIYTKINLLCVPIGIIIGILCAIFTFGLKFVTSIRNNYTLYVIPFLCVVGLIIVFINEKFDDKEISVKSGMKLVFMCGQNKKNKIPLILIPLVSISTWLSNLCGGSCGREGVAVQIGATFSKRFSQYVDYNKSNEIFTIAGIGAGFSAMFQTPLAGIFFALEVLTIGKIKIFAICPTIVESIAAYLVARFLFLEVENYDTINFNFVNLNEGFNVNYILILQVMIAAVLFAIVGDLFSTTLERCKTLYEKYVKNKYIGIFVSGIILSILFLLLHFGRYSGTGSNLILMCFDNDNIDGIFVYDFILKAVLTILTLSVGFYGGEVTPLFTIGATFGFILAKAFSIDTGFLASLGFISVFASATNTVLCPIFLGIEVFGLHNLPFYVLSVVIAYFFNFNKSIYVQEEIIESNDDNKFDFFQV